MSNKSKIKPKLLPVIKLDLGCGQNKIEGFTGVDLYSPNPDVRCDLFQFPFRDQNGMATVKFKGIPITAPRSGPVLWKDGTVDEIHASHFVEHIPQEKRWPFFEECWRILKPDGKMNIAVPNWKSERSYGDMTHQWPPVTAFFFFYLNKAWREANKLTYGAYDLKCNFEHAAGPAGIDQEFASRSHEVQMFALVRYHESYQDMWVSLTKKPM